MKARDLLELDDPYPYDTSIGRTALGLSDLKQDDLVDADGGAAIAAKALQRAANGQMLSEVERKAIKVYAELFKELLTNPSFRVRLKDMIRLMHKKSSVSDTDDDDDDNDTKKNSKKDKK